MRILSAEQAAGRIRRLCRFVQLAIVKRLDVISDFPEMSPVRERQPYSEFRYFFTAGWCGSYITAENNAYYPRDFLRPPGQIKSLARRLSRGIQGLVECLYSDQISVFFWLAGAEGFEPPTSGFGGSSLLPKPASINGFGGLYT